MISSALLFLSSAENIFDSYIAEWSRLDTKWQNKIKELQLEIYYVRATRVFIESSNFDGALIEMKKGLNEVGRDDKVSDAADFCGCQVF